jgi:hypothetical protein
MALGCYIGAGAGAGAGTGVGEGEGMGSGVALRGRTGPSAWACSGVPEEVEHADVCFCPCSNACWSTKRANLAKNPV